jgi:predicted transcriptional regulator
MRTPGLWAHSRKGIEIPERADGARCALLRFAGCRGRLLETARGRLTLSLEGIGASWFQQGPLGNEVQRRIDPRDMAPVVDRDIFINIFMPTTVHIPDPLLKSVDRRAKALGISRNRLVVRALEQAVSVRSGWAPEFLQRLRHVDRDTSTAVDELLIAVTQARRSKEPHDL